MKINGESFITYELEHLPMPDKFVHRELLVSHKCNKAKCKFRINWSATCKKGFATDVPFNTSMAAYNCPFIKKY